MDIHLELEKLKITNGGVLQLKAGTYILDKQILFPCANIILRGEGYSTKLKIKDNGNFDAIYCSYDRCKIEDLCIDGNRDKNKVGSGIHFFSAYRPYCHNLFIENTAEDGIKSDGTPDRKTSVLTIDGCVIEKCKRHSINNKANSQDLIINNTFTEKCSNIGLLLDNCYGCVISNSHFFNNGSNNIVIKKGGRHRFNMITSDRSSKFGMRIMSSSDIIVNQSIFFDNLGGVVLDGKCVGCIISNNTFYDEQKVPTQKFAISSDKKISSCILEPNIIRL